MVAVVMLLASCSDNNKINLTSDDSANVEGETTADSYMSDAADVSTEAVAAPSDSQFGGREATGPVDISQLFRENTRLSCATITIEKTSGGASPAGVITIVFPSNGSCKDFRGIARRGTITITYTGPRFVSGSKIVTTFTDYYVGGVKVEGTHTLTNITPTTASFPRFTVEIVGGKLTFLNGKTITRAQSFTREWQRGANPTQDKWVLLAGSTASGSTRNGKEYLMTVTKDVVHSRACMVSNQVFIAVSGEKVFTTENKQITINFGDGACDNIVTITINGKSKDVTINGDGN